MEQIQKEDNLAPGQESEIIWLLWQRKDELNRKLKEWELDLSDLSVDYNSITEGLKVRSCVRLFEPPASISVDWLLILMHMSFKIRINKTYSWRYSSTLIFLIFF